MIRGGVSMGWVGEGDVAVFYERGLSVLRP